MRVAIDPCQLRSWTTEETIAAVAEAGFEAIELSPREGLLQHRGEDPPDAAEVKRLKQAVPHRASKSRRCSSSNRGPVETPTRGAQLFAA